MIYFDNAATSFPKAPNLAKLANDFIKNSCFNVNRSNYSLSYKLEEQIAETRDNIKKFVNAKDDSEVVFTSGVTAALNTFINGTLTKGDSVLVSSFEHNAVMRPLENLYQNSIISYKILPPEETLIGYKKSESSLEKYLDKSVKAVIINHVSNVSGDINDIKRIGSFCKKHSLLFCIDSAASLGSIKVDMSECNIDFLAFSGHKGLLGLQGVGGAVLSKKMQSIIKPLIHGGTGSVSSSFVMPSFFPDRLEAGTLNILGILSINAGLKYINDFGFDALLKQKNTLREYFKNGIETISGFEVVECKGPHTATISVVHKNKDIALIADTLDKKYSIATRAGLQCAPLAHKTLGTFEKGGTLRFSFSHFNTKSEVDRCLSALEVL